MKLIYGIVLAIVLIGLAAGYPAQAEWDPEQGHNFEGDILLSKEQELTLDSGKSRNGLVAETYRWPDRTVYYKFFEPHFDEEHKNHVLRGIQILEEVSCIKFVEADESTTAFVNITAMNGGCYSNVGYLKRIQSVNFQLYDVDTGCFRLATIVHEFLHTLGFYHQQSAADRDDFVEIRLENVQAGTEHNFNYYSSDIVEDFGIQYDYGSVMHYGPTAFSKNGLPTIIPLDPTAEIGQRRGLSAKDIFKLNIMYKCPIPVKYAQQLI